MSVGMVAVFEMADRFEAEVASARLLEVLNRTIENDLSLLDYLRFYEYFPNDERRKNTRLGVRNQIISFYENLLRPDLPVVVQDRVNEVIRELRQVPIGSFCSLLFVPDDLNFPPSELRKMREREWERRVLIREPFRADPNYKETWDQNLLLIDFLKDLLERRKPKKKRTKPD